MGIQFCKTKSQTTMKVLLVVALAFAAVVAEPEADADAAVYYSGYYGHPGYYGYGLGGYYGGYPYRYGYGGYYGLRHFGKRSADAEPEADADAAADAYYGYYGRGYGYGYGLGYGRYYGDTTDTPMPVMDTVTLARGPLMPNLKLMPPLMLTTVTTAVDTDTDMAVTMVDTTDTPMVDTVMAVSVTTVRFN